MFSEVNSSLYDSSEEYVVKQIKLATDEQEQLVRMEYERTHPTIWIDLIEDEGEKIISLKGLLEEALQTNNLELFKEINNCFDKPPEELKVNICSIKELYFQ